MVHRSPARLSSRRSLSLSKGEGSNSVGKLGEILNAGRILQLDFVGLNFKEKVVEFFLMVSGSLFYHVVLRPVNYYRSLKKKNQISKPK